MTDTINPTTGANSGPTPAKAPTDRSQKSNSETVVRPTPYVRTQLLKLPGWAFAAVAVPLFAIGVLGGVVCRSLPKWDLTQPQAVLIAGVAGGLISGSFLVVAAWIAFHGQAQNRIDERDRHNMLLTAQRDQSNAQLDAQREQWRTELAATSDRAHGDNVRALYVRVLNVQEAIMSANHELSHIVVVEPKKRSEQLERIADLTQQDIRMIAERRLIVDEAVEVRLQKLGEQTSNDFEAILRLSRERKVPTSSEVDAVYASESSIDLLGEVTDAMRKHLESLRTTWSEG